MIGDAVVGAAASRVVPQREALPEQNRTENQDCCQGMPAGVPIAQEAIDDQLRRRQGGYGRGRRMAIESDRAQILSGIRRGKTTGGPIALVVANKDWPNWQRTMHVEPEVPSEATGASRGPVTRPRPGHADLAGALKYELDDIRDVPADEWNPLERVVVIYALYPNIVLSVTAVNGEIFRVYPGDTAGRSTTYHQNAWRFPLDTDEALRTPAGRVMSGIQFFEAQIDDQLLPRAAYDDLLARHGFTDIGSAGLTPMHALTWGRA